MNNDTQEIIPISLPFDTDDKIFTTFDEKGNIMEEPYSYNEFIQMFKDISGVSEELLGPKD
jgi:hypothetical protein